MKPAPAADHIEGLTAFRGIAALIVVVFHYSGGFLPSLTPSDYTAFLSKGYLWVDFFFVLSGFVLAHVYAAKFQSQLQVATLKTFVFARFSRIYPLHLVILLGYLALELVKLGLVHGEIGHASFTTFEGSRSLDALVSNIFLLQTTGIHDGLTWNGPAWSIGAEWFAYLAFPVLVIVLMNRGPLFSAAAIMAALVGLVLISDRGRNLDVTYDFGLLRCAFEFIIGMLLHRLRGMARQVRLGSDPVCLALIVALGMVMHFGVRDIFIPPLLALLVLSLALNDGAVSRALSRPVLLWLGAISYSVYLSHMLILAAVNTTSITLLGEPLGRFLNAGESLFLILFLTAIVLVISAGLHRHVELRAQALMKKSRFAERHIYD